MITASALSVCNHLRRAVGLALIAASLLAIPRSHAQPSLQLARDYYVYQPVANVRPLPDYTVHSDPNCAHYFNEGRLYLNGAARTYSFELTYHDRCPASFFETNYTIIDRGSFTVAGRQISFVHDPSDDGEKPREGFGGPKLLANLHLTARPMRFSRPILDNVPIGIAFAASFRLPGAESTNDIKLIPGGNVNRHDFTFAALPGEAPAPRRVIATAAQAADVFMNVRFTRCGDSQFTRYQALGSADQRQIHQFRGLVTRLQPTPLSPADRANGLEYRGTLRISAPLYRSYDRYVGHWTAWNDNGEAPSVQITKENGRWYAQWGLGRKVDLTNFAIPDYETVRCSDLPR
ncbi:MAG TPA: hypothetical protein VF746_10995 [Longimicrobium sp.]|jgi:hypothetical protein